MDCVWIRLCGPTRNRKSTLTLAHACAGQPAGLFQCAAAMQLLFVIVSFQRVQQRVLNCKDFVIILSNKKVLLRERKRHTARRVVSTPSVVLTGSPPQQGTPPWAGFPPVLTWLGGYPTWVPPWAGYPPVLTWLGGPP